MLAEELYKITGGENIIFVSSMENLVFESIHFRPFRFVRKSHLEEELTEAVESWIQQNTKTECLEFDETGEMCIRDRYVCQRTYHKHAVTQACNLLYYYI